ncbi:MAG: IS110 family transposase [Proteobacteria bacterium]|nr:IS110 family transposase [Pseudomonadota bacterium]MBU1685758.1 IS110 family transposase [Pseudomonadota bacterium]
MQLYAGIDLHSNNSYLAISDEEDNRHYKKRLPNQADVILAELETYRNDLVGIVVESTFNWYWLVDTLMDNGYEVHLANPAGMQKDKGLKHSDDTHDAFWLARLLRLGILAEGYIYPKEWRPVRDLLRKRGHLVRLRTSLIKSLQGIISRNCGHSLPGKKIKQVKVNHITPLLASQEDLAMSGAISKDCIDYLSKKIREIEVAVEGRVEIRKQFAGLQTVPGIGKILSLAIMLETGDIGRFVKVGNFSSYCRKVPTTWTSNGKKKGKGNSKNGNRYLAWAFSEAAEFFRRYDESARAFYNRKAAKTNFMVAHTDDSLLFSHASKPLGSDQAK